MTLLGYLLIVAMDNLKDSLLSKKKKLEKSISCQLQHNDMVRILCYFSILPVVFYHVQNLLGQLI